jgi:hypothetical protein
MKTQHVENLVVEVDVRYKPLLKASELLLLLLLLLRHDDKRIRNTAEHMEVKRMIVSSGEVGRAAPLYVLEVR